MKLTLAQASELAGISRSGLLKAIKRGTVSAVRDDVRGQWLIDAAELSRVYAPKSAPQSGSDMSADVLSERVRALERLVETLEDERADLRRRLDLEAEERRRLTYLLTHQQEKSADAGQPPHQEQRSTLLEKLFGRRGPGE
jgi:hypothetical protein